MALYSSLPCKETSNLNAKPKQGGAKPLQDGEINTLMLPRRWFCGQWLENSAQADVAAPVEHCFRLWEDRELIPNWMPWITSVKVRILEIARSPDSLAYGTSLISQGLP